ncbi:MAG: hypothetical protein LV481_01975 [Methylacidiphilales bacterium]|nr:hypothetical protein [Candidatus Methylacidiphilales bacterium]
MGPMGFFAAPVLALFGWPFFPVVLISFAGAALGWHCRVWNNRRRYCLTIAFLAAALFALIGLKEEGKVVLDTIGYALGAFIPGLLGLLFLTRKR